MKATTSNPNETTMITIGIDISKDYFDACIQDSVKRFDNQLQGFKAFMSCLQKNLPEAEAHCVMESTGNYGARLALYLYEHDIRVSLINPLQTKRFGQSQLRRAKTDTADAELITQFASVATLTPYEPKRADMTELEQLQSLRDQLVKQHTALLNQLHALEQLPKSRQSQAVKRVLMKSLKQLEKTIAELDRELDGLAKTSLGESLEQLSSIPAIGKQTAIRLLLLTDKLNRFESAKQLVAFFGLCPRWTQSGSSVNASGSICKSGNSMMRSALYLCACSATRCNAACQELYVRLLAKGKPKKLALIAVANKLLRQAFAVVKKHMSYDDKFALNL
jgi:transposase